jgi:hypothetical protein
MYRNEGFMVPMMTAETAPKRQLMRFVLAVLALLSGLCTILALVVTVAEAWQEHAQERWPAVTAHVDRCVLDQTSTGRRENYYIDCRLSYVAGDKRSVADVSSAHVPSRELWQYPPNQIGPFEDWVADHPPGTPVIVRYNPANRAKVVLAANYMPRGGPRTQGNIELLEIWAGSFFVLLAVVRITRPKSLGKAAKAAYRE